jgi:hypothetical protein
MYQVIAILLLPLLVMGNSHSHCLAAHCLPGEVPAHIHTGFAQYHSHEDKSHTHGRHAHSHQDHRHNHKKDRTESTQLTPVDHDADAVYLSPTASYFVESSRTIFDVTTNMPEPRTVVLDALRSPTHNSVRTSHLTYSGLPLYLLHAALTL